MHVYWIHGNAMETTLVEKFSILVHVATHVSRFNTLLKLDVAGELPRLHVDLPLDCMTRIRQLKFSTLASSSRAPAPQSHGASSNKGSSVDVNASFTVSSASVSLQRDSERPITTFIFGKLVLVRGATIIDHSFAFQIRRSTASKGIAC